MFKHILMPTDGSAHSERAIERGIELAKLCGAKITGIHVMQDFGMMMGPEGLLPTDMDDRMEEQERERATSFLAFVARVAAVAGVPGRTMPSSMRPMNAVAT